MSFRKKPTSKQVRELYEETEALYGLVRESLGLAFRGLDAGNIGAMDQMAFWSAYHKVSIFCDIANFVPDLAEASYEDIDNRIEDLSRIFSKDGGAA